MTRKGVRPRTAAAELVTGVINRKESLDEQIQSAHGPVSGLSPEERARSQSLARLTLRNLNRIDAALDSRLSRRPGAIAMGAMRIAVAEMAFDGIPAHAAVNGAVETARSHPKARRQASLVNAVLRKMPGGDIAASASAGRDMIPDWIARPVVQKWGEDVFRAIADVQMNSFIPVDLTPKRADGAADLSSRLGGSLLPTGSIRLQRPVQVSELPGYSGGEWWVQDAAAAVPARLLEDLSGKHVLDICAAPGGKTMQLASAGARVTSLDISDRRLGRLRDNLKRTGLDARIVVADALQWQPERVYDAILLDAPCTATGTLRRHPDLPFIRSGTEVGVLTELQKKLLEKAWEMLAVDGVLVFCTCSLLPAEGEEQASRFLETHPDSTVHRPSDRVPGIDASWIDDAGGVRLRPDYWSEQGGMDGFYAIAFRKQRIGT